MEGGANGCGRGCDGGRDDGERIRVVFSSGGMWEGLRMVAGGGRGWGKLRGC